MDWTMVNNAEAGERLAMGSSDNPLCKQTIAELRAELTSPSTSLGMVRVSYAEARVAFDETAKS
jgi:hypothetical protein